MDSIPADSSSFLEWFTSKIEERLGKKPDECSVLEIHRALGLGSVVSSETVRRMLKGDVPSRKLAEIVRLLDGRREPPTHVGGGNTRALVESLASGSSSTTRVERVEGPSGLRLSYGIGGEARFVEVVRCLDDGDSSELTDEFYLVHLAEAERTDLAEGGASFVTLVTHGRPSDKVVRQLDSLNERHRKGSRVVSLIRAVDLYGRFFQISTAERSIRTALDQRGVGQSTTLSLPATVALARGEKALETIPDVREYLRESLLRAGPSYYALLGPPGSGKSTLCLLLARDLLLKSRERTIAREPPFPLPLIVHGNEFRSTPRIEKTLSDSASDFYGLTLAEDLTSRLIADGHFVVFLDGLDEIADFQGGKQVDDLLGTLPGATSGRPRYVLTCRQELFQSDEEERTAFSRRPIVRLHLSEVPAGPAKELLTNRLGHSLADRLTGPEDGPDSLAANEVGQLMRRPLFFQFLNAIESEARLRVFDTRERSSQPEVLYNILDVYTRQWVSREKVRERARELRLGEAERLKFCMSMAGWLFDPAQTRATFSARELDQAVRRGPYFRNIPDVEIERADTQKFLADARLSMFLERDLHNPDGDHFRFGSRVVEHFFLANALVVSVLDEDFDLLAKAPLSSRAPDVAKFVYGNLCKNDRRGLFEDVLRKCISTTHSELHKKAVLYPNVLNNLATLAYWVHQFRGAYDESDSTGRQPLKLWSLYLPGLLSPAVSGIAHRPRIAVNHSNLEFAHVDGVEVGTIEQTTRTAMVIDSPPVEAIFRRLEPVPASVLPPGDTINEDRLSRLTQLQRFVACQKLRETRDIAVSGFDDIIETLGWDVPRFCWSLVPGGKVRVGKFEANTVPGAYHHENGVDYDVSVRRGEDRVIVPSFLMQTHPVTNGQFLRFLMTEAGDTWLPETQRQRTRNDYYLRVWEGIATRLKTKEGPRAWLSKAHAEGKNGDAANWIRRWLRWPVTQVSWNAATAFAEHYGLALPTEAEFEVAARMYHPKDADMDATGPYDNPWGVADTEGFAHYYSPNNETPYPMVDCTALNQPEDQITPHATTLAAEWAERMRTAHHNETPPLYLVDLVREWMRDDWHAAWPLSRQRTEDSAHVYPVNDGLDMTPWGHPRVAERNERRVIRGGSILLPQSAARISYRDSQPRTNVNPDVGFRCVKRLWALPR
jgi:formylglycine-generating enzyme required for sulfatase activity/DNA polymerase III delta prime subunit